MDEKNVMGVAQDAAGGETSFRPPEKAVDNTAEDAAIHLKIEQAAAQTQAAKVRLEAERMAQVNAQRRLTALEELQAEIEAGSEVNRKADEARRARLFSERRVLRQIVHILGRRFVVAVFLLAFALIVSGVFLGTLLAARLSGGASVSGASQGLELAPPLYSAEAESERLAGAEVQLRRDENEAMAFPGMPPAGAGSE